MIIVRDLFLLFHFHSNKLFFIIYVINSLFIMQIYN